VGLVTIFYCLRFETSIFVASYASQVTHLSGTRIEKELEIYATNLVNKAKCMSNNAQKKMEKFVPTARDICGVKPERLKPYGARLVVCYCSLFLFGLYFDPEDGGHVPPKRRALSQLHDLTIQNTLLSTVMSCVFYEMG
jgi:hypothetical protein